jgi:hypothetical protein
MDVNPIINKLSISTRKLLLRLLLVGQFLLAASMSRQATATAKQLCIEFGLMARGQSKEKQRALT